MRLEGVLEFLEPMAGYAAAKAAGGEPVALTRPDLAAAGEAGSPAGSGELLGSLVGKRPLLLFINDAVDAPLLRALSLVPVLMEAWKEHADYRFIAVNIHDWHYASGDYHDYLVTSGAGGQHHAWSQEERARRLSMRLIQVPHAAVPALVDTPSHTVKDRYASGGGQNSFWLVGTDGLLKHRNGGPFMPLNQVNRMEQALARLVASGGAGDLPADDPPDADQHPRPTLVIAGAVVREVDAAQRRLVVEAQMGKAPARYECRLAPHTALRLDGTPADLNDLKAGDRVQVRAWLDQAGGFDRAGKLPPPVAPWQRAGAADLVDGDRRIAVRRVHHGYVADYDLFLLQADSAPAPLVPRLVAAFHDGKPADDPAAPSWRPCAAPGKLPALARS